MRKYGKIILTFASMLLLFSFLLPIMSVEASVGESCVISVRGINLMTFSAWGVVPLIMPLIVISAVWMCRKILFCEWVTVLSFAVNSVCYVHGCNAARSWLQTIGDSLLTFHPALILLPIGYGILVGAAVFWLRTEREYLEKA